MISTQSETIGVSCVSLPLPLSKQLESLANFNLAWGGIIVKEQFAAVDTSSDHVQTMDHLRILYVDFGSPSETMERYVRIISDQAGYWNRNVFDPDQDEPKVIEAVHRWGSMKPDSSRIRLAKNCRQYEPGIIHIVDIDMSAAPPQKIDRTLRLVNGQTVRKNNLVLAHGEALAAICQLLILGIKIPPISIAGYEIRDHKDSEWKNVRNLCFCQLPNNQTSGLYLCPAKNNLANFATPLILV